MSGEAVFSFPLLFKMRNKSQSAESLNGRPRSTAKRKCGLRGPLHCVHVGEKNVLLAMALAFFIPLLLLLSPQQADTPIYWWEM